MKILWVSNAAFTRTGYANGTRSVVPKLQAAGHEVVVLAYWGLQGAHITVDGIEHISPRMETWCNDYVVDTHRNLHCDLTLIHRDNWVTDPGIGDQIPLAAWFPVDSEPVPATSIERMKRTRWNATMSRWGQARCEEAGFQTAYLPHSFDPAIFKPTFERTSARRRLFKDDAIDGKFLVTMVGANKGFPSRKGFPEAFEAMADFMQRRKDVYFYVHSLATSEEGGPDLPSLAKMLCVPMERFKILDPWLWFYGLEEEDLAMVYQATDVLLHPSYGEGFGIPLLEAQACGTPVIAGRNSSQPELIFENGQLIEGRPMLTHFYTWWQQPLVSAMIDRLEKARNRWLIGEDRMHLGSWNAFTDDAVWKERWSPWIQKVESEL